MDIKTSENKKERILDPFEKSIFSTTNNMLKSYLGARKSYFINTRITFLQSKSISSGIPQNSRLIVCQPWKYILAAATYSPGS